MRLFERHFKLGGRHWIDCALILLVIAPGLLTADDSAHEAAATAVSELGGSVRPIASNSDDYQVDFSLGGTELTDDGLAHIAHLDNVVTLNLKRTKITSAGLVHLKGLPHRASKSAGDSGL